MTLIRTLDDMSAFVFNVTFDCAHPRSLSQFSSAEIRDDFVRVHDHEGNEFCIE